MGRCRCCLSIVLLLVAEIAVGSTIKDFYRRMSSLPSKELLERGNRYLLEEMKTDSAIVCFNIVEQRYSPSASKQVKRDAIEACNMRFYSLFVSHLYSRSFEYLQKAMTISREIGETSPQLLANFGFMYQIAGEQTSDKKINMLAIDYFRRAYLLAVKQREWGMVEMVFPNLFNICKEESKLGAMHDVWQSYASLHQLDKDFFHHYNILLYEGYEQMSQHNYDLALSLFQEQLQLVPREFRLVRYRIMSLINIAESEEARGNNAAALSSLQQALSLSRRNGIQDMTVDIYESLAKVYRKMGNAELASKMMLDHYELKDSITGFQTVYGVESAKYLSEIQTIGEQMTHIEQKRRTMSIALLFSAALILCIIIFTIVLYRKNKRLHERNLALYNKYEEIQRLEDGLRHRKPQEVSQADSPASAKRDSGKPDKSPAQDQDDEATALLRQRIEETMDDTQVICNPDFTVEQLAQRLGERAKVVSGVINRCFGKNFSTLLGEYRVREASRRLSDQEHYSHYTIEAIALSVGFRSRSHFALVFHKVTGLTPSEYQSIARGKEEAFIKVG